MTDRTGTPWSPRVAAFLLAEAISAIGSFATIIAIWAYAAYRFHATPGQIALYGLAFSAPGVVLGPITGVVIDRIGPRQTLLGAKALGVVASILLLSAHDFGMLTLLSALHGVGGAFARPALNSLPPRMVADEHLARTNALVGLTDQLSIVLGPVAAGIAIGAFGFKGAFVFDGLTYALGIAVLPLLQIRDVAPAASDHAAGFTPWRDAIAGWKLVAASPVVRRIVIAGASVNLLYGVSMLAEPLYVRDVLHRSTTVFAGLQTVFGVFLVLGGLVAARVGDRMATYGWVVAGVAGSGLTAIVYLATGSLAVAVVGVSLWGVCTALIWGPSRTVLQRATAETVHGRVMATDQLASNAAMFVGLGVAGVAIGAFGVRSTILVVGTLIIGAAAVLGTAGRRSRTDGASPRPQPATSSAP